MDVLSDSFSVLVNHWQLISGTLLILVLGQILVWSLLKASFDERLTRGEYYSLSLAGWMLPISLAAGIWLLFGRVQMSTAGAPLLTILVAIVALSFLLRTRERMLPGSKTIVFILIAIFAVSIFLRLAFVSQAVIPQYFDSAQHYLIIKNLINSAGPVTQATTYYHMGFHLLTAFVTSSLRTETINTILILGQVILVTIPLSVFFLIKHETQSSAAGVFAILLATVGWYMPAYAVNWGKYPALTSLPLMTFVLSLAYLSVRYGNILSTGKYRTLNALLVFAILLSGLTHSRSLIILAIIALAWVTAAWWQNLPRVWHPFGFFAVLLGIIWLSVLTHTENIFGPLFDPYWNQGWFVTSIVLFLSLFALWAYPKLTFAVLLVILLLLGSLFMPITVPGYGNLTLLDRPFVEMLLYLPLALLGGAGLAGLEQSIGRVTAGWHKASLLPGQVIGIVLIGLVLINVLNRYTFYPSDCCTIVGRDDLVALDWVDRNLPPEARVLISSTELRVLATDSPQGLVSGDAGAWVHPLTGRATLFLPYHSDFTQQTTLEALCQVDAEYIYVGETGLTFNNEQLASQPDWYKNLLSTPKVQVYQVTGCN